MSRAPWAGRGSSAKGASAFSSAATAAPGPSSAPPTVNLGPPVGLPSDVLQHILTFVDGRELAVCEQVCKGLRSTASDKALWRNTLHRDFAFTKSQRMLTAQSNDPRAMYGRRLKDTHDRSLAAIRRAQQAKENIGEYQRKRCLAQCLVYGCSIPMQLALAWSPFLFLLLLFLRLDQKIEWSWWAIFAPAYGPLYLFVLLACGLCGLRIAACNMCELLTEEATCAIPCSRKYGQRLTINKRRRLSLFLGLLTVALVATWFVTMALKMERTWDVSWAAASFPLWIAFGFSLLFAMSTICAKKPSYGALALSVTFSALTLVPALIVKADGKHIRLDMLFLPEWMGYGMAAFFAVANCILKAFKCVTRRRCRTFIRGAGKSLLVFSVMAPVLIPLCMLTTNDHGATDFKQTTVFALPLALLACTGLAMSVVVCAFAKKYGENFPNPAAGSSPGSADVFRRGEV